MKNCFVCRKNVYFVATFTMVIHQNAATGTMSMATSAIRNRISQRSELLQLILRENLNCAKFDIWNHIFLCRDSIGIKARWHEWLKGGREGIDWFNDTRNSYDLYSVFHKVIPVTLAGHPSFWVRYDNSSSYRQEREKFNVHHLLARLPLGQRDRTTNG